MKSLGSIDLYTGLIIVCVVLLPVCGWWCMKTTEQIDKCEKSVREATRRGGELEEIGGLQKKIEVVNDNRGGNDPTNARTYFEGQIFAAASRGGGLKETDFTFSGPTPEPARISGSKQKATDHVLDVRWTNKELALRLDFIESLLWNCESGAGLNSTSSLQSIWKLRDLSIVNMTEEKALQRNDTPPKELKDRWSIRMMKFARREPSK